MKSVQWQVTVLLATAMLPASASAWLYWKHGKWSAFQTNSVTVSQLPQRNILWVDARSAKDYARDHVPGAVRLTEDDWNELLPNLLKAWETTSTIVVYCNSQKCHASNEVAKRLREEVGLKNVYTLRGGWTAWKGAHNE